MRARIAAGKMRTEATFSGRRRNVKGLRRHGGGGNGGSLVEEKLVGVQKREEVVKDWKRRMDERISLVRRRDAARTAARELRWTVGTAEIEIALGELGAEW